MLIKDVKQRYANGGSRQDAGVCVISAGIGNFAFAHTPKHVLPLQSKLFWVFKLRAKAFMSFLIRFLVDKGADEITRNVLEETMTEARKSDTDTWQCLADYFDPHTHFRRGA